MQKRSRLFWREGRFLTHMDTQTRAEQAEMGVQKMGTMSNGIRSGNDRKALETSEKSFRFLFGTTRPLVRNQSLGPENPLKSCDFSGFSHENCLIFAKSYSLIIAAQDLRCGFDKLEFVIFPSHRFGRDSIYPIM